MVFEVLDDISSLENHREIAEFGKLFDHRNRNILDNLGRQQVLVDVGILRFVSWSSCSAGLDKDKYNCQEPWEYELDSSWRTISSVS